MKKHPTFRCPRVLLLLSMATLLSLLFLLVLLPPSPSAAAGASPSQPPSQVRQACRATRFPSSCESTLTKSRDLTPLGLTLASLSVSSAALPTARSLVQSILAASSSNLNRSNAARNCLEHLSLSDRRLATAAAALPRGRAADSHQDTLYARSLRQLYRRCRISGTVDFVFGNAAAVFDECLLEVVTRAEGPGKSGSDAVTAQGRMDPAQATGFVFRRCAVNGSEEFLTTFRRKPKANRW